MEGSYRSPRALERSGQTLIGILVVLVIMMVGYSIFLGPRKNDKGEVKSAPKAAMDKSTDLECSTYLGQVRQAISMYGGGTDENERPASLADLGTSMQSVTKCPVGGEDYVYDSQTGKVHCPHPGHEEF
ncbi:MAG: hypothetical protein AUJ92_08920 [Armatimonadetes bacterium CG2_30_59_28]|nr:hypothetical protein [Armatimonadota bacterium]OIO94896.1 MAG: hypothetical protein AUJ92_08920 [Armatimonadetes bacterium CG2_30_59_28]PIU60739.1 MAG: hypothetical protein COS85_22785 [Armatimonadetes bacterium CG07_land_8_20_14_0_80_59_28]PIX43384.1 MAG: hypothetical protein COZ56_07235 [Armatimonadetes bacterium CG_4_8_14_3_um_filter_58_9]PIY42144.1 MAG: hypothetical protein COZ05_14380 [Armatimonadetes bacterium CG_4_10_14_3_um_filter_59_10]PJB75530.1 MAG: hypothetical protein CO095_037